MAALALVAKLFHNVDDLCAGRGIVGGLRKQIFTVIRHSAGHRRDALHHRGQLQQVCQRAAQLIAVVDAAAQNQLAIDRNAAFHKARQVLEHLAAPLVGEHPHPKLRVGGVDRNVDRRDMHLDDALDLVILHIGHGDIVAEQKGQPLVIIFKVQALPHTGRELIDEAEHAVIGAGVLLIAQIGLKVAPERPALCTLHVPLPDAVRHLRFQVKAGAVGIKIVVQRVVQRVFVHAQQLIAGAKTQSLCLAACFHTLDPDRQCIRLLFS